MSMTPKSPFENMSVLAFRTQLWQVGRDIDHVLEANNLSGEDAQSLKVVGLALAKSGIQRRGKGDTVLDRVTTGIPVALINRFLRNDDTTHKTNERNKAIMIGYCDRFETFSPERMAKGLPQSDDFLREAAHELEALERICTLIDAPWEYLGHTEYDFHEKVRVFREFENDEIGHFYEWQKVDDPFSGEEPGAPENSDEGAELGE